MSIMTESENFEGMLKICQYPFVRQGMSREEFDEELAYFTDHYGEVRTGKYKPLWQQKADK